ncbi:MAG: DUF362 domain-containing protein [Myxococcales bacterium]|nr:DUF362 domain-containing protein [Myxococcales bacterium]
MTTKPGDLGSKLNRRQLLCGGAAAITSIALSTRTSSSAPRSPRPQRVPKANVTLSHAGTHAAAIGLALDALPALSKVRRGDTILLKVNANSGDPFPYSTSPTMIRLLGGRLRDCGAQVIVGDRSFWGDPNTFGNLERNGIAAAARNVSAKVVSFDDDIDWIRIPEALVPHWRGRVRVPRYVRSCDQVINLPCVKTHFITSYTMALKNVLGLVHPEDRARRGNLRSHDAKRIYHQIADINKYVASDFHIIDGFRALITGGPTPQSGATSTIVSPGIIIGSKDPLAADAAGIALLRTLSPSTERVTSFQTWENPMLKAAMAAGIGKVGPKTLSISGSSIPNLARIKELASS